LRFPVAITSGTAICVVGMLLLGCVLPAFPAEGPAREGAGEDASRERADAPWPAFHGNAARDGNCTEPGPGTNKMLWSNNTGANCYGSPVVAGGRVYIGSTGGTMYCFAAGTGVRLWTFATGGSVHSTPWVDTASDRLYFGSHDTYVYCLNATSGSQVWRTRLGGVVTSCPLVMSGMLYVGCGDFYYGPADGYLYCLRASDGTQAWRTANAGSAASPAFADGRLFSVGNNNLQCLDPSSGTVLWRMSVGAAGYASPSAAEGRVYYASMRGRALCFNASDGTQLWDTATGYSESHTTPAISNGSVFVGADNGDLTPGALLKLDASDGSIDWTYSFQDTPWSSPVVSGDRVYFSHDRTIECVQASDHSQVWSHLAAAGDFYGIGGSPAIAYNRLYLGGAESKLYCFGAAGPNFPPAAPVLRPADTVRETSLWLRWSLSTEPDFSRYEVHRSLLPGFVPGPATRVLDLTAASANSANVTGLNYSTSYRFKVRVWDNGDPPMFNDSNEVEATTATPNGAPAGVTVEPPREVTPYSVRLSWSRNADADFARYEVHRGTTKGYLPVPATLAATFTDPSENSTTVPGLRPWTTYFFKVRVYDNGTPPLHNDSNEVEVRTGNTAPFAVTLSPPQMGAASADLSWSASADDDFAAYEVHLSQNGSFVPDKSTLAATIDSRLATDHSVSGLALARTYHFLVRVVDQGGLCNDSNLVTGLTANTLPRPVITSPSDGDLFDTRTPVVFDCSKSSDQDLDPLSFHWTSSIGGHLSSNTTFTTILPEGAHRITLYVNDGHGHNVSARVSITVNKAPNRRPAVAVLSPADNSRVSGVVWLNGTASDIDGNDTLRSVEVKISRSGWEEAEGAGEWTYMWNTSKAANGKYKVLFRSYDGDLYSAESVLNLVVENVVVNLRPGVSITGPPATWLSRTAVITGTASDPDGQIARVEVSLNGGGWQAAMGTSAWSFTLDTTELRNGRHSLQVRAFDGKDYSEAATLNFTVANTVAPAPSGIDPLLLAGIGLAVAAAAVAAVVLLARRRKGPPEAIPPQAAPPQAAPPEAQPVPDQ